MPTKQPQRNSRQSPELVGVAGNSDYGKLLAFVELASGFNLAVARFDFPSVRSKIISQIKKDAAEFGVFVETITMSPAPNLDFLGALRDGLKKTEHTDRLVLMVVGVDELFHEVRQGVSPSQTRSRFVSQLNLDREQISRDLPYPIVLWLENESMKLLSTEAPDFVQWVSARFDFEGLDGEEQIISGLTQRDLRSYTGPELQRSLSDLHALLKQLNKTQNAIDQKALRQRFDILDALGEGHFRLSQFDEARERWNEALEIAKKLNDRRREAAILLLLGQTEIFAGDPRAAIRLVELSLAIAKETGNLTAQSLALSRLGDATARLGDLRRAIHFYQDALNISRKLKDTRTELGALVGMGNVLGMLGEHSQAEHLLREAVSIARELSDRRNETAIYGNLGISYANQGRMSEALQSYEMALEGFRELGDRRGEGSALNNLGLAHAAQGQPRRAIEFFQRQLSIARDIGDRRGEANALGNLGNAYVSLGEIRRGIDCLENALRIDVEFHDRRSESQDLGNLGVAYTSLGDFRRATGYFKRQLEIARDIGDRPGEASALWNMSLALNGLGDRRLAISSGRQALHVLQEIRSPKATEVEKSLAEWQINT